ncbi:MAG TPA: isoprenylcysteine carboxylmethyltransferase family protein [Sphingomicrobium sp.]|nr:isoprenylcysteine carboxylmethyltransferase family protein [Sphingomicrobium sp.]
MVMVILAYGSPYAWLFWAAVVFAYAPECRLILRSRPDRGQAIDRGSTGIIMLAAWIAFPVAFYTAGTGHFRLAPGRLWFAAGIVLLLAGSCLRRYCWRQLGRYFTGRVMIQEGQTVIDQGPYRWVRHPSYTGGMMMHLGCGLALENWMSASILLVTSLLAYLYRVKIEERALMAGLGESYRLYMRRTKRFVPFVI